VPKGGKFWQDRFWEHTVRDDDDRERCVEYIHYNPVKHGIVNAPRDWKYSSFNKYVERGIYPADWGDGASVVVQGAEYD
jgi:putative transposase